MQNEEIQSDTEEYRREHERNDYQGTVDKSIKTASGVCAGTYCCGRLFYVGLLQYRAIRERSVQKARAKTASAISAITQQAGTPLYSDATQNCSMHAPEEFSAKKPYCDMRAVIHYKVSPDSKNNITLVAKKALEEHFGVRLDRSELVKSTDTIDYEASAHPMTGLGIDGITCGIEVRYPAAFSGGAGLPLRTFNTNDSIMSVLISCDKQVVKNIYPMVNR